MPATPAQQRRRRGSRCSAPARPRAGAAQANGDVRRMTSGGRTPGGNGSGAQGRLPVLGRRSENIHSADLIIADFHRRARSHKRYRDVQKRVRRALDDSIERVRISRNNFRTILIIPPVFDRTPRPFLHVEDVFAQHRETAFKSDVDAVNRRAHERDGDDPDDDAERGQHRSHLVRADLRECDPERFRELVNEARHL